MKTTKLLLPLLAIFMVFGPNLRGGDISEPPVYRIETRGGTILMGTVVSETETEIVLNTESFGNVTVAKQNISKKELYSDYVGKQSISNPNRYFVLNNYTGVRKGTGYYQNTWILFNQINYGITDNVAFGVGTVPLFLFGGPTPFWVVPSFSIPVVEDKFSLGASFQFLFIPGERGSAGFLTLGGTIGNRHNNLTLNLGYGMADGEWAEKPLITLSGMVRTGKRHYLLMENYFLSAWDETFLISLLGGRYNFGSVSLDYGLILPWEITGEEGFIGLPWLGLSIPIGNK